MIKAVCFSIYSKKEDAINTSPFPFISVQTYFKHPFDKDQLDYFELSHPFYTSNTVQKCITALKDKIELTNISQISNTESSANILVECNKLFENIKISLEVIDLFNNIHIYLDNVRGDTTKEYYVNIHTF